MVADTVHIVDDDSSFLRAMARFMEANGYPVQTYRSAQELLKSKDGDLQGCIITDLSIPDMNGLELQQALFQRGFTTPIIFLTGNGDVSSAVTAMKSGAIDFLEKCAPQERLLEAVRKAFVVDERMRREAVTRSERRSRLSSLTDRELEVLAHVVQGKMNKEIASELSIHERTVKLHRTSITTKLRMQSVAELTRLWMEAGNEVTPGETSS
jgi:FixJ family two-component response regulator